jgi:thymidine kinase
MKNKVLFILLLSIKISAFALFTENGHLTVITGPMYAGKTSLLLDYVKIAERQGFKTLVFKHLWDTRLKDALKSHDKESDSVPCIATETPMHILHLVMIHNPKVIFIDETQFFVKELAFIVRKLLEAHVNVLVAGLDMNYRGEPFGETMAAIREIDHTAIKVQAMCNVCRKWNATMTQRLVNGEPAGINDEDIIIEDGTNLIVSYEPRCKDHHILR